MAPNNDSELVSSFIESILALTPDPELRQFLDRLLRSQLQTLNNPSRCLERLRRFVEACRLPRNQLNQWEREPDLLGALLRQLDVDSPMVEWLIADPDAVDWFRVVETSSEGDSFPRKLLLAELKCLEDDSQIVSAMQRFRRREQLRAMFAMTLQDRSAQSVEEHLSKIVEDLVQGIFEVVVRDNSADTSTSSPIPVALVATGRLGGAECDFTSPCDLLCIYEEESTSHRHRDQKQSEVDLWQRKLQRLVGFLLALGPDSPNAGGMDVRFPLHARAVVSRSGDDPSPAIYEWHHWLEMAASNGSALHRTQLLKARPIAGDLRMAQRFVAEAANFVFPKYLSRSEIASLAAYLRKIERASKSDLMNETPASLSAHDLHGILSEIRSLVLFLQLIHGSELDEVRSRSTLEAIDALLRHGCLTSHEHSLLVSTYALAQRCSLQFQIRTYPAPLGTDHQYNTQHDPEKSQLSLTDCDGNARVKLLEALPRIRQMANHLRGQVFSADDQLSVDESDLILDPNPNPDWVRQVLERFHFHDIELAHQNLKALAVEDVRVLSTQRCRYFLAVIAPKLLERVGHTPSPDLTLNNLVSTCRSIGAKGVLWELFSLHEPSMDLYVRLCGASPYLVSILNSHPGMIDELLDSLVLGRLPTQSHLSLTLDELCRGAEDIDAIVQSFKNTVHLSIGVRDILGKENVSETHRTLADVADVCLQQTIHHHFNTLVKRYGIPTLESGNLCRFGVIALGKLGSREPNYHSDVTVLFLFEGPGATRPVGPARHHQAIGNDFFFHQLAQRVAQGVNRVTRHGRLYELHHWQFLRERQSNLAWPVHAFLEQFLHGNVAATQRMLLSTSRIIAGDPSFEGGIRDTIRQVLREIPWTQSDTDEALSARSLSEQTARPENLKRGVGGTMDVETLAQILSMQQSKSNSLFPVPGTIDSIELLRKVGAIPPEDALQLKDAYNFLRGVESGLRLMNSKARHDLPKDPLELARLAFGLHIPDPTQLQETCDHYRHTVRTIFERVIGKSIPQNDRSATSSSPPSTEELHR